MKQILMTLSLLTILCFVKASYSELSINPPTSEVGTSVIISGGKFDITPANNQVTFKGTSKAVSADWVTGDGQYLLVKVPQGATDGSVSISVKNNLIGKAAFNVKSAASCPSFWVWIGIALALVFRTFVPFFNKKLAAAGDASKKKVEWDWWLLVPPLGALITSVPVVINLLPSIGYTGNPWQDFLASFSVTYASQDIIRELQKTLPNSAS